MKEIYFWVSVLGFGVVSVSEVVSVEADYASLVVGDSAVNFDVGVHLDHVGGNQATGGFLAVRCIR